MKKRTWKVYYKTEGVTYRMMTVNVPGVSIEGFTEEAIGVLAEWKVTYRIGDKPWTQFDGGKTAKIAEAKTEAEKAMERLVDRAIKDLQKWRGK